MHLSISLTPATATFDSKIESTPRTVHAAAYIAVLLPVSAQDKPNIWLVVSAPSFTWCSVSADHVLPDVANIAFAAIFSDSQAEL